MNVLTKATAISDAKITFVSLVNKAANKRRFLITKAEKGKASFQTYGEIIKTDNNTHYVTGVVYEPMTEDTDGNFMTADEILKAEKYYSENFGNIDIQHSFEPCENLTLVDSWITKCDCTINGQDVKSGSWLMTVKVEDNSLWEQITKGEITGFSMGGVGVYSDEDVDLQSKTVEKGLFVKFANALGYDVVKKGTVEDKYKDAAKTNNFWAAKDALDSVLRAYDYKSGTYIWETDAVTISEALKEFTEIVQDILLNNNVQKAVMQSKPNPEKGEKQKVEVEKAMMKKEEIIGIIKETTGEIVKSELKKTLGDEDTEPVEKSSEDVLPLTADELKDVIKSTVQPIVAEEIKKYNAVRGKTTTIEEEEIEKAEDEPYFMHGIL